MFEVTVITSDQIAQDDIIRVMMYDNCMPEYQTIVTPNETTYRVHGYIEDVARTRSTIAKNLDNVTMYICEIVPTEGN